MEAGGECDFLFINSKRRVHQRQNPIERYVCIRERETRRSALKSVKDVLL